MCRYAFSLARSRPSAKISRAAEARRAAAELVGVDAGGVLSVLIGPSWRS
jgi:hypothetical protein